MGGLGGIILSGVGDFSNISFKWLLPGKDGWVQKRNEEKENIFFSLHFVVLAYRKQSLKREKRGKDVEQNRDRADTYIYMCVKFEDDFGDGQRLLGPSRLSQWRGEVICRDVGTRHRVLFSLYNMRIQYTSAFLLKSLFRSIG